MFYGFFCTIPRRQGDSKGKGTEGQVLKGLVQGQPLSKPPFRRLTLVCEQDGGEWMGRGRREGPGPGEAT